MEHAVHGEVLPGPGAKGDVGKAVPEDVNSKTKVTAKEAESLEQGFGLSFMKRGLFPTNLYDDTDRAPVGTTFPTSKAVATSTFVERPDFQKLHDEVDQEDEQLEKNKTFGKAAEKGAAFRRLTAGATTHPWDRDGKNQEREVEEHAMREMEDDVRRRNKEEHEARAKSLERKRITIREALLGVD